MGLLSIKTYNYRNLENNEVKIDSPEVFLTGTNGQGKTNFLEIIYFLCFGASFRTRKDKLLITAGTSEMGVQGKYNLDNNENTVSAKITGNKKSISVNGKRITDRKEIINNIPCIIFSHDDISFVNGSPERRRWFFNQVMSLYDPFFIDTLRKYNTLLKMRNKLLKEKKKEVLDVINQQLAVAGIELQIKREKTLESFNKTFIPLFSSVSGVSSKISLCYKPSWKELDNHDAICAELEKKTEYDLLLGTTTTGPHRDKFQFFMNNTDFSQVASTGQLRLMSLLLRVAQALFFNTKTGRKPILLLDDVLLELDLEKRKKFLALLPEYEQIIYTFLPDENISYYKKHDSLIFIVKDGKLTERG